ncbi:MAG: hypothetical protein BIFFINMI_02751 [Phycisphaerae bacterium]|nr:hypothetical protein [Phycisphaerae bacterium]
MSGSKPTTRKLTPEQWENLPDEQLLSIRIRDLGLSVEGSWLAPRIEQLHAELESRGITFRPPCYLADEWLCPDRVPMIGIPFYLAHPRLRQLEQKMMLEVEGGTEPWCMKLLRHETGHAINYAHEFFRRTRWRKLFGPISLPYDVHTYATQPYSRRFVVHLKDNYAQAHPEEDFAETFAVWLDPASHWSQRYAGWPALRKLQYVDHLMAGEGTTPPRVTLREELNPARRMTSTLAQYYNRRRSYLREGFPGFYDPGLQKLFVNAPPGSHREPASAFLRRWRRHLVNSVCMWTADRKYDVDELLRLLVRRCDALGLHVHKGEVETAGEVAAFLTASMNRVHNFEFESVAPEPQR